MANNTTRLLSFVGLSFSWGMLRSIHLWKSIERLYFHTKGMLLAYASFLQTADRTLLLARRHKGDTLAIWLERCLKKWSKANRAPDAVHAVSKQAADEVVHVMH
jgi:hypothetical protein